MRSLAALGLWGLTALAGFGAHADILIGVAGPMTGKDSWPGEQMQRGAERAVVEVNAAGGVLGEQVELISADDFCDPEQATAAARKLVSQGREVRCRALLLRRLYSGIGDLRSCQHPDDLASLEQS